MSANPSWPAPPTVHPVQPAPASAPPLAPGAALQPVQPPLSAAPAPVPPPRAEALPPLPAQPAAPAYRIWVRLADGERVEVASHADEAAARTEATALMRYLRDGRGDWPFVAGRFLRPDRIVSVDVDRS